jgi:hypothetical protein
MLECSPIKRHGLLDGMLAADFNLSLLDGD